jgi:hypothetical protein
MDRRIGGWREGRYQDVQLALGVNGGFGVQI